MNLILESTKCKSLSISAGSSKVVKFKLSDQIIESIENSPKIFLVSQITFSGRQSEVFQYTYDGIKGTMENINNSLIWNEYKLKVYNRYLMPAIRFKLTVHKITTTNLTKLDLMVDGYIKRWLYMPQSVTCAVIHMPEALNIKSISHLYKECHATSHTTSRIIADQNVNLALDSRVQRESQWVRKDSVTVYSEGQYQTAAASCDNQSSTYIETMKKKVKLNIFLMVQLIPEAYVP